MGIERKHIKKHYLILSEGKDAQLFLFNYLESEALSYDQRFSNDIQVFDFGGNEDLTNFLLNLKNMDKFDRVDSLAIIRDAEKDYDKACHDIKMSLQKCGFPYPEYSGQWIDGMEIRIGFMLFPLDKRNGTLEDLCLGILSEENNENIVSSINDFLDTMESDFKRNYRRKHKNKLHTYFSSSDEYVTMQIGLASKAGAFDWNNNKLEPLKQFLFEGFYH